MDLAHPQAFAKMSSDPAVCAERLRIAELCEREAKALAPADWRKAFGSDTDAAAECVGQIDALETVARLLRES